MSGCNGKMGQVITRLVSENEDFKIVAGFDLHESTNNPYPVFTNLKNCDCKVDVIIDFSNPAALEGLLQYATLNTVPIVVSTTGLTQANLSMLEAASKKVPVFFSANLSLGINILIDLVK